MDVNLTRLPEGIVSQVLVPFPSLIVLIKLGVVLFGIYSFFALISRLYSVFMYFWSGKFIVRNSPVSVSVGGSIAGSVGQIVMGTFNTILYYGAFRDGLDRIKDDVDAINGLLGNSPETLEVTDDSADTAASDSTTDPQTSVDTSEDKATSIDTSGDTSSNTSEDTATTEDTVPQAGGDQSGPVDTGSDAHWSTTPGPYNGRWV